MFSWFCYPILVGSACVAVSPTACELVATSLIQCLKLVLQGHLEVNHIIFLKLRSSLFL